MQKGAGSGRLGGFMLLALWECLGLGGASMVLWWVIVSSVSSCLAVPCEGVLLHTRAYIFLTRRSVLPAPDMRR